MKSADANDEEVTTPFLGGKSRNTFTSITSEEPRDMMMDGKSNDRKLSLMTGKKVVVFFVSVVFLAAVVAVVCVVTLQDRRQRSRDACTSGVCRNRTLTLEDVLSDKYSFDSSSTQWVSDNTYLKVHTCFFIMSPTGILFVVRFRVLIDAVSWQTF